MILLGFGESLATPEVFWSLRSGGYEVAALFRRGSRSAARKLKGMRAIDVTSPETSVNAFRTEVHRICSEMKFADCCGILPMDDASLLLLHDQELDVPLFGPKGDQARLAIDKSLQFSAARAAGFAVPDYIVIDDSSSVTPCLNSLANSAVIAKPAWIGIMDCDRLTRPSARYFDKPAAAIDWLKSTSNHGGPWIVQRVQSGVGEGVFGIADESGLHSVSGHRRIRMMNPAGSGSSACASAAVHTELKSMSHNFCASIGWSGLFMIELLRDQEGRVWFMELNGRPWGSMALARRQGLEYPLWHVRQRIDGSNCPNINPQQDIICRHLGRELVHLLFVLRGNRQGAPMWPSRFGTIMKMLRHRRRTHWYNTDRSQRLFALWDAIETVRKQLG